MSTNRRNALAGLAPAVALALAFAGAGIPAFASDRAAGTVVRVVSDDGGERLAVDGREMMVFGMNWGYMPIGENYNYSLWNQSDELIEEALAREMPLLREMGVNAIRQYAGIPPRWVRYIYEHYGIYTVVNPLVARYGYTLDGLWIPSVDYSDEKLRAAVKADIVELVDEFRGTPGVLMWLLGNENNYGLSWSSFEIEALPEGERDAARARYLYSLMGEIVDEVKRLDPDRPVAMANGDVQYIDIIAEECPNFDVFGTNVYRGISARDLFDVVEEKMGIPVMFTEFGSDAYNAKEMREDQPMQARYLLGQWEEIYEQSSGKGRAGNAIGGFIFQWSDGWWKYGQDSRLDVHDTHASWPNGGYDDFVEGENNMNEEWWGITAKGPVDSRGLYEVYPRAAYYALRRAFALDPYAPGTDLAVIRAHFGRITPAAAALEARGDRAALLADAQRMVRVSGLRAEFETYSTGGERVSTPSNSEPRSESYPSFRGFDQMESFYIDVEAQPSENVVGSVSVNVVGNVPENPIDEIFYENRARPVRVGEPGGQQFDLGALERVKVYRASVSWDDPRFQLDGFYRTGHLHWGHEGDFFGLYRDAFYGENIDIYNGMAPVGFEMAGKKNLSGLKLAFGPQLWWGANPAVFIKYSRNVGPFDATAIYQEDITKNTSTTSSIAVPVPETRKVTLQFASGRGPWGVQFGGIWSGEPRIGEKFQIAEIAGDTYVLYEDKVVDSDAWGGKAKLTFEKGRYHWYAQSAVMGVVAEAGPTPEDVRTFTGWELKDSGKGNQSNFLTGLAVNAGNFQFGPNFLWQKPIVGPVPGDVPPPGRPRNVRDDPFAVRENREMFGAELMITYDPTPATWLWEWDNDVREDARFAASLGFVYRDLKTTADASIYIAGDGVTQFAFTGAPPARDLWETNLRIVSKLAPRTRLMAKVYAAMDEPKGYDPEGLNSTLNRAIHRYGVEGRFDRGPVSFQTFAKFNDWGPYDYHEDFNLTYPAQLMGDLSYNLGKPAWFDTYTTRIGVRGTWRSLDENSPRYCPNEGDGGTCDPTAGGDFGNEWEIRTYLHLAS